MRAVSTPSGSESDGDGSFATGDNVDRQCNVSGVDPGIASVSAGNQFTVGLRSDGSVVATGSNLYRQCNVDGWSGIAAVSAGGYHTVGLKQDGSVVTTGSNTYGQCNVAGWSGVTPRFSAGSDHTVGLKADGTVLATGNNVSGQCNTSGWTGIVAVSAGRSHTLGIRSDGSVLAVGPRGRRSVRCLGMERTGRPRGRDHRSVCERRLRRSHGLQRSRAVQRVGVE